jgi:rhodanese-related sulfurtransferase
MISFVGKKTPMCKFFAIAILVTYSTIAACFVAIASRSQLIWALIPHEPVSRKGVEMKTIIAGVLLSVMVATTGMAQNKNYPKAKVSFQDFKELVAEVEPHRASRLIDLNTFLTMSREPGVIILDSRSTFRFDRIHVKGAKHLSFTDFTQDNLGKVLPSFETKILIYCNNNFDGNQRDFATKAAWARPNPSSALMTQFASQGKPIMMALNVPTYINLYGYGYHNVYELNELVKVTDPRISFEGTIVEPK